MAAAKARYRDENDVRRATVAKLRATGTSQATTLREASVWAAAWNEAEPAWNATPGGTLTAFNDLIAQATREQVAVRASLNTFRTRANKRNLLAQQLEDASEA